MNHSSELLKSVPQNRSALHERLQRYSNDPPEYGRGLSNHLPMVLTALSNAGADEARLDAFASHYRQKILAQPAIGEAAVRYERYDELSKRFRLALEDEGPAQVLRRHVPLLLDCIEAAAFHCVIRLSHALDAGQLDEIANALAFWSICHQPLVPPEKTHAATFATVQEWFDALHCRASADPHGRRAGLITDRFLDVAQSDAYRTLAAAGSNLPIALNDAVREIGLASAKIYAMTGNFTVLHMVTGAEALLHVIDYVSAQDAALKRPAMFASIAAALLAAEPIEEDRVPSPELGWQEVQMRAMHSDDEHVVKLIYSSANWNQIVPDAVWLAAARRALVGK